MDTRDFLFSYRSYTPVPIAIFLIYNSILYPLYLFIGIGFVLIGESIRVWAVQYAGGVTRTTKIGAPSLCTSGPYARTRNPLYLGNIIIYIGITFIAAGPYIYETTILIFLYFIFQYSMIISLEEETLKNLFENNYKIYCENVPRLFPRLHPWIGEDRRAPNTIIKTLQTEKRTLQNIFLMILIIVIKNIINI